MPANEPDVGPPAFDIGDEVTTNPGNTIYVVKQRSRKAAMWVYDCFLKDDINQTTKPFPERLLKRPEPPALGRAIKW